MDILKDEFKASEEQLENLKKAASWIKKNVPKNRFSMREFWDTIAWSNNPSCETVACFIGWCPQVPGLETIKEDYSYESSNSGVLMEPLWRRYSQRIFGLPNGLWSFCFAGIWEQYDNTIEGAVDRVEKIVRLLEEEEYDELFRIDTLFFDNDVVLSLDALKNASTLLGYVPPRLREDDHEKN